MAIRVVTAPGEEPVSLVEAKAHLRLEETADDTYVTALIVAARTHVEKECQRGLVLQTLELKVPALCGTASLTLPGGRLADTPSVEVYYLDEDGEEQQLAADDFFVVDGGEAKPGLLRLVEDTTWPDMLDRPNALRVRYRVGWANAAAVPASLRHAVLLMISELYEKRSPEAFLKSTTFDALTAPFRFMEL